MDTLELHTALRYPARKHFSDPAPPRRCSPNFRVGQDGSRAFLLSQFSSVAQSYPTLCDPMNRSTPGLPVHHQLLFWAKSWTKGTDLIDWYYLGFTLEPQGRNGLGVGRGARGEGRGHGTATWAKREAQKTAEWLRAQALKGGRASFSPVIHRFLAGLPWVSLAKPWFPGEQ